MNVRKISLSIIVVAVSWFIVDSIVHGSILTGLYLSTAHLWRPLEEMSQIGHLIVLWVSASLFVMFYQCMIKPKTLLQGLQFGCWYGVAIGFGAACFYLYMPIPIELGLAWFVCNCLESVVAGLVVGYFLKDTDIAGETTCQKK